MEYEVKNDGIVIGLSGRINSDNSEKIYDEISAVLEKEKGMIPSFNVQDLEYISSAGLRVLMRIAKKYDGRLRIFNANPEVYNIFDMTGFTGLFDVKKEYRSIDVSGCEVIGKGFYGTVYRLDEDIILVSAAFCTERYLIYRLDAFLDLYLTDATRSRSDLRSSSNTIGVHSLDEERFTYDRVIRCQVH